VNEQTAAWFVDKAANRAKARCMQNYQKFGIVPDTWEVDALLTGIYAGIAEAIEMMREAQP
jgi:hypothetical protein